VVALAAACRIVAVIGLEHVPMFGKESRSFRIFMTLLL
jgi:hypothetical protein